MQKNARDAKREQVVWLKPVVALVKGGAMALVICVAVLPVAAALMYAGLLDRGVEESCVIAACLLGALVGGIYTIKRCNRAVLPMGVGVGVVELAVLLTVGTLCFGGVSGMNALWSVGGGCLCGGLLAGVLSAVGGKGRQRKR